MSKTREKCCFVGCDEDATWEAWPENDQSFDTLSCDKHLVGLFGHRVEAGDHQGKTPATPAYYCARYIGPQKSTKAAEKEKARMARMLEIRNSVFEGKTCSEAWAVDAIKYLLADIVELGG